MSSRFEFLGNTMIGQYIPRESWFHVRDPRAKLISFVMLLAAIIFTPNLLGLLLGLIFVALIYFVSDLPLKPTWKNIKRALPFIIILAILQIIFSTPQAGEIILWQILGIEFTEAVLISAATLIFRFIVLIALINVFVMSLSTAQISTALFHLLKPFEKIGFPVNDLTMVVQITMRYLPLVAQLAEKTAKAQAARGGDWEQRGFNPIRQAKRVLPLIVPILVNSLKRAETMATAMESRGFNAADQRSSFYALKFTWQDCLLLGIFSLFTLVILLVGVLL